MSILANIFSLFLLFTIMSIVMFIFHESNNKSTPEWMSSRTKKTMIREQNNQPIIVKQEIELQVVNSKPPLLKKRTDKIASVLTESLDPKEEEEEKDEEDEEDTSKIKDIIKHDNSNSNEKHSNPSNPTVHVITEPKATPQPLHALLHDDNVDFQPDETEKKGTLICHGKKVESEVIYWRKVKGDRHYESPITPHHE
jgi:hypothetical protein